MANENKKPTKQQRKKPLETKYYHEPDEAKYVDSRVQSGKFKNRQHYLRELIRLDRERQSR